VTSQSIPTRNDLLVEMRAGQVRVVTFAHGCDQVSLATMRDAHGWNGLDHLSHLNAWERALISWLEGGTRARGLGVTESLWESRDIDAINEAVRANHASHSLDFILSELDCNRRQLIELVGDMSDDFLARPYSHYPADDPEIKTWTVAGRIERVVGSHVDDHLGYIRRLLSEQP
jgi:hypothetical protein